MPFFCISFSVESMGKWKMEEIPLPTLFDHAQKIHSTVSESAIEQETLRKGIEALQQCARMIRKLGLFSANESQDDISTTNLKYLLVPFYLGEMMEKVADGDKIQVLKISQDRLKEFVSSCETLELVPEKELNTHAHEGPITPADQRAKKIARLRHQKAAESKLQEIKERKGRRRRSSKAADLSTPVEAGEEDMWDDDSEEEREAWLTTISLAICRAFDLLEMLMKEEEMLSAIKELQVRDRDAAITREVLDERIRRAESWHRKSVTQSQYSKPTRPITCATFAQDVIEGRVKASEAHEHKQLIFGPAIFGGQKLTCEKERMATQVFQPGYRLPTLSIEEAGLREMEMMRKEQERNAKVFKEANSSWHKDSQTLGDEEAAEEKVREWDDWKDDHPRGAGNKKLTPCG